MDRREELETKINKLTKLKKLFLALGIILLVVGFIVNISAGVLLALNDGGTRIDFTNYEDIMKAYSNPAFIIPILIASLLYAGGVALLVLRGTLLSIKLRRLVGQLSFAVEEETI